MNREEGARASGPCPFPQPHKDVGATRWVAPLFLNKSGTDFQPVLHRLKTGSTRKKAAGTAALHSLFRQGHLLKPPLPHLQEISLAGCHLQVGVGYLVAVQVDAALGHQALGF